MKKLICVLLTAALLAGALAGCGAEKKEKNVDLAAVYDAMQQTLPEMMTLDEENMLNLLGIRAEDCTQAIAAVCAVGLQADEVWLLQAKDAQALERLKTLAASRMAAKLDETESYLPDQYVIVKKGVTLTDGNYLAFLISPDEETLQTVFQDAMK